MYGTSTTETRRQQLSEHDLTNENESAYCRGARAVLMIRECRLPTTEEIAEECGLTQRGAFAMLEILSITQPIYQQAGRWLWNGNERAWAIADLVERIVARHASLDALIEELREM